MARSRIRSGSISRGRRTGTGWRPSWVGFSAEEHRQGRPLLTAVVVISASGLPEAGFFDLAKSVGRMAADEDRMAYFVRELKAVHDFWAAPPDA